MVRGLGKIRGVVEGVHRLALLPCLLLLLLQGGRMSRMGLRWVGWSGGVSLALLAISWARSLVEPLANLPWSHGLVCVSINVRVRARANPGSHGSVLGLITRVLVTAKTRHALLVLVGVRRLSRRGLWVSGCVAHCGIALGLRLGLRVSHLGPAHSNVSQVVRGVLSRRVCHALWRVVLVNTRRVGSRCALHPTVVALRHLVASHLVGTAPRLCRRLLIS